MRVSCSVSGSDPDAHVNDRFTEEAVAVVVADATKSLSGDGAEDLHALVAQRLFRWTETGIRLADAALRIERHRCVQRQPDDGERDCSFPHTSPPRPESLDR